jgi:hypothetical protein
MSGLIKAGIENDAGTATISADELTGSLGVAGSAVFTQSTNNIALTNIGSIGLAVGDVITVAGTSSNNKEFTVEVITDANNVIVNQAHAGGTTKKSLINETSSATVTLLVRAASAGLGVGQAWVNLTASRSGYVTYTNQIKRVIFFITGSSSGGTTLQVDGNAVGDGITNATSMVPVAPGSTYEASSVNLGWWEHR